ncbi:MAG: ferritin [Candidatus Omnitrophota bacterium]
MINERMEEAFNKQINEELFSAYLYLSMSGYFESENLRGLAHWIKVQAYEELYHAMKFFTHIVERGGTIKLQPIAEPKHKWTSPREAFFESLQHEKYITKCIDDLYNLAYQEKDNVAKNLLSWFAQEQVEEENSVTEIVAKLKMIGEQSSLVLMLDSQLSSRKTKVDVLNASGSWDT